MTRMGDHIGYRIARRPKPPQRSLGAARYNDPKYKLKKTVFKDRNLSAVNRSVDGTEEEEYWKDYNTVCDTDEEDPTASIDIGSMLTQIRRFILRMVRLTLDAVEGSDDSEMILQRTRR
ncbi:hypothetical protein V5O48_010116 [Marasmius crinis-equi]|uniref:Uncharacterized protein n=1 Tax=Marasmius crinis-equi TaxID=585013 RepID=A0ABR3F9W8_9AGAR